MKNSCIRIVQNKITLYLNCKVTIKITNNKIWKVFPIYCFDSSQLESFWKWNNILLEKDFLKNVVLSQMTCQCSKKDSFRKKDKSSLDKQKNNPRKSFCRSWSKIIIIYIHKENVEASSNQFEVFK